MQTEKKSRCELMYKKYLIEIQGGKIKLQIE